MVAKPVSGRAATVRPRAAGTVRHYFMTLELSTESLDQLIEKYRHAASAHGRATVDGDNETANRNHDIVAAIYRELRQRGTPAQLALLPLLQDSDDALRSWAASHALEFKPEEAEPVLEAIAASRGILAFNAKMTLRVWRNGDLALP